MNNCQKVNWESTFYSFNCVNTFQATSVNNWINIINGWDFPEDKNINMINSVELWSNCENSIWSFSFGYNTYNVNFSWFIAESTNLDYCIDMESCEDCIFCIWLRNKKYCILNKQYSKEDYFIEKEKIIGDLILSWKWWNFIPFEASPFPYNDTLAYDYFKVNKVIFSDWKEEVIDSNSIWIVKVLWNDFISDAELDLWWEKIKIKWRTKNKEINIPENMEILNSKNIKNIDEVWDDILKKAIICEETGRPFRIIKQELDYLKKKWFPIPRIHQENRIDKVFSDRPTWQMFTWICDKCEKETLSVFKNKPKHKVYCAECYKNFMYS
jgi:CxxC-x17-CxxC domain-containing protein